LIFDYKSTKRLIVFCHPELVSGSHIDIQPSTNIDSASSAE